jgi:signal transduction histidine kinase
MFACSGSTSLPSKHIVVMDQDITDIRNLQNRLLHADRLTTLGKISASLMHEIKNSLQAVAGYAELALVKEQVKNSAEPEMCKIIDAANGVDEMCDLLKSMIRRDDIKFSSVDPRDVIEKAITVLSKAGAIRNVPTLRRYCTQKAILHGNALLLQQVFINLIINAAHAMENIQKKSLHVGIACDSAKHEASLFVRDTGCGIPKELRSKIFEPFYSTYLHKGGTGLGLSIVKQIVELHRGTISVASVVGRGSMFTVTLPLSHYADASSA